MHQRSLCSFSITKKIIYVIEIEPIASGSRVTHAWVAGAHWEQFAPFGKDISGVEDRATHNLRNMGVTLDNLVKALDTV
jgi:hypothetical protein